MYNEDYEKVMHYLNDRERPPCFEVRRDAGNKNYDWCAIYAPSAARAAEKWARDTDDYDYSNEIALGTETPVLVRRVGKEEIARFVVTGEVVHQYHAEPAE